MKRNLRFHQSAFTLLEIMIAVMILAIALTTLLSLQSSSIKQALRTRNALEAMLASRSIMAGIEFSSASLKPRTLNGSVVDIAQVFLKEEALRPMEAKQQIVPLQASLIIEPWTLPVLKENSLLKVTLTVGWSSAPSDQITTYYFLSRPEEEPIL